MDLLQYVKNNSDMINLVNSLAPEHLQIMTKNPKSIFVKNYYSWISFAWKLLSLHLPVTMF